MAKNGGRTIYMEERAWMRLRKVALRNRISTSEAIRQAVEYAWFDSEAVPGKPDQPQSEEAVSA